MPFIAPDEDYSVSPRASAGSPALSDFQSGASAVIHQDHGLLTTLAGDVGLGAVDLVDTVASSIPGFHTDRGTIDRAALNAVDLPGLNDFYNDNQGGIEAAGGVLGIVGSELIARRLTAPASVFMAGLSKLPYVRRLATLDAEYANAMQTVRNVDTALASRGAIGVEQYVGRAVVDDGILNSAGTFNMASREVGRASAVFKAKGLGFLKGARQAGATEGIMALTLNQNGFLYDDDAGHNLAWMGLGLAVGGATEWLHGAYQIRKFVNSDEVRRTFASALDPEAVEESRLLWHGKKTATDAPGSFLGGTVTDRITSLLVNSSLLRESPIAGDTGSAASLLAQRDSLATQHLKLAREEAQKVTTRGISTNGFTRFSMDSRGFGNHLDMMMYRDPGVLYGAEMVGGIGDDMTIQGVHSAHLARIDERIGSIEEQLADESMDVGVANKLTDMRKRLEFEKHLTPVAAIDGELMPISEAEAIEGFVEPDIRFTPGDVRGIKGETAGSPKDQHGLWEALTEHPRGGVSLDSDLTFHLPGRGKNLNTADHFDVLRLYRLAQRAIPQLAKFEGPIMLPKNPNWFQLDMAEEILKASNGNAKVMFPTGMSRDTAQVESLTQKAEALRQWDIKESQLTNKALAAGETYDGQLSKLRVRYNLPRLTAYERGVLGETEHPVERLLRGIATYGPDEVRQMSLNDLKDATARIKRLGDVAPVSAKDMESLSGNSFKYMLDESGQPIKPLIVYKRPLNPVEWTREQVAERIAAAKMQSVATLTGADASPMTRAISTSMVQSPDFDAAARTHELMDVQIQGGLTGSAPQTAMGSMGKALVTSEWRDRDNPILLAATRLRESVNRQARDYMKLAIESSFGDSLGQLENPRNAASKLLLNQFHSYRSGWDLARETVDRDGGFHGFTLADTEANRTRFAEAYGRDMPKGQTLIAPNGREVVLDDLGLDLQQRFNAVTDVIRAEKNTLLRANGRSEIKSVEWYTPPPNTNGKFIGFVMGPDGKVVPGLSVVESTQDAFNRSRQALMPKINELGMGYTFRTQDEIRDFASVWDRAQMDFIDPGTTAIQPNKRSRGALTGAEVRTDAFKDSLHSLRDQMLRHGNDIVETLLKDQINAAKARANIASDVTRNRAGFFRDQQYRSIYDMYVENLTGSSKLNSPGSMFGRFYNSIEGTLDKFLDEATPPVSKVWTATNEWINKKNPWSRDAMARKDFDTLATKLGPYMPFESATQMLERQGAGATAPTMAKITGGINRFSAAMLLRLFEVGQPIMNLAGILNAAPSVIRHITPREGESAADYAARVGHSSIIFNLPDGQSYGALDMAKMGARGFQRAWSRGAEADYDYMVRNGFLHQEVAEFQRQFGAIETKKDWQKFFVGDPLSKNGFAQKGLVGWASVLTDHSEDFSRSWAHMIGLELADDMGIVTREAKHSFAHDVANKMIANYSPANRQEIFQGAIGAPLGLFQSFSVAYYQRLFRYLETKDFQSLGLQYAVQAGMFGVTGVPGYQQFANWLTNDKGGTPTDGLYHRFPGTTGSLLGSGAISMLPHLFGQDGVDLATRGDLNVRVPGLPQGTNGSFWDSIPGTAVLKKVGEGIANGIHLFSSSNPTITRAEVSEVVSNMLSNRPLAGIVEQTLGNGDKVDRHHQLVTDTRSLAEMTYRLIGLRSERQSREINAYYANKSAMEHKAAADDILRASTRAAIREGNMDSLPQIFETYLKNGGDPRNFRRWVKSNYESATSSRAERQLKDALHNPSKMDQVVRLLDAGVGVKADVNAPDTSQLQSSDPGDPMTQDTMELGQYPGQVTTEQ